MQLLDDEPPRVVILFPSSLRLKASTSEIRSRLAAAGYPTSEDIEGLDVTFDAADDRLANSSLTRLLQELAAMGVAFADDYKQSVSPAAHVSALIERGVVFDSPRSCSFNGRQWMARELR